MKEKERIIELVKQNVISMEEALDLLEAASKNDQTTTKTHRETTHDSVEADFSEEEKLDRSTREFEDSITDVVDNVLNTGKSFAKNVGDYFHREYREEPDTYQETEADFEEASEGMETPSPEEVETLRQEKAEQINQLSAQIAELDEEFDKRNEALIISKQRLREIEIFAELDELTPEMESQRQSLEGKKAELEDKLNQIQTERDSLYKEKEALGWKDPAQDKNDFKDFFSGRSEKFSEVASQFGKEASREGKKWGSFISKKSKDFIENFNVKDVNLSFQVPWIKTVSESYQLEYTLNGINHINFELYNGSLEIESYDGDKLLIDSDVRFHGNHDEISKEYFESLSTITSENERFVFKVNSPKISLDARVQIPASIYDSVVINLLNGDVDITGLNADNLSIKNKNGDVTLIDVTANDAYLDLLNGDILVQNSPLETLVLKSLNGDIRVTGYVRNIGLDAINSDVYLTKKDGEAANIKAKTVSGDIKLSLPEELNLSIEASATNGDVYNRLSNVNIYDEDSKKKEVSFQRTTSSDFNEVTVKFTSTTGDVYFKDSQKEL